MAFKGLIRHAFVIVWPGVRFVRPIRQTCDRLVLTRLEENTDRHTTGIAPSEKPHIMLGDVGPTSETVDQHYPALCRRVCSSFPGRVGRNGHKETICGI